jgi:hypothetical protein
MDSMILAVARRAADLSLAFDERAMESVVTRTVTPKSREDTQANVTTKLTHPSPIDVPEVRKPSPDCRQQLSIREYPETTTLPAPTTHFFPTFARIVALSPIQVSSPIEILSSAEVDTNGKLDVVNAVLVLPAQQMDATPESASRPISAMTDDTVTPDVSVFAHFRSHTRKQRSKADLCGLGALRKG